MDGDVRDLVARAAGPPTYEPDTEAIRAGVRRRRRIHRTVTVTAVLLALVGTSSVNDWIRPARVQVVAADTSTLVPFDHGTPVDPGLGRVPLTPDRLAMQPTLLPPGYVRCDGPGTVEGLTSTSYCGPLGHLIVRHGRHASLSELGRPVQVGVRTAWFDDPPGSRGRLTISDRDSMDDTHYQLEFPLTVDLGTAVGMLTSIPDIRSATQPTTRKR